MLEQQLVPDHVGRAEGRKALGVGCQLLMRVSVLNGLGVALFEAFGGLTEHGVENGVL